jgi:arylsulfatase A-like enzyme
VVRSFSRLLMKKILLFAILVLIASCGQTSSSKSSLGSGLEKSNLLLISIDSLRADRLGFYGHTPLFAPHLSTSPNLDRLASQSIVFDQAWSSTSWTLPAHASLFTGLDDLGHGVVNEDYRIDPAQQTVAEFLAGEGYQCFGVYSGPYLKPRWGFDRGFEQYHSAMKEPPELQAQLQQWIQRRAENGLEPPTMEQIETVRRQAMVGDVSSPRVNQKAVELLEKATQSDAPFFLFLHYFDVHFDYIPEQGDVTLGEVFDPNYGGTMDGRNWLSNPGVRDTEAPFDRRIGLRDLQHIQALYDGEVHWVDHHIGLIMKELERLGLAENTVIAVVSDHGDEFFDHGGIGHQTTLYPELTKMAFLLHVPGAESGAGRNRKLTSMMDVAPTVLDAIRVGEPWKQAMGHTRLVPSPPERANGVFSHLIANSAQGLHLGECWRGERFTVMRPFSLRTTQRKTFQLIQKRYPDDSPAYLVYDRLLDPTESKPISPQQESYRVAVQRMAKDFGIQQQRRALLPRSEFPVRLATQAQDPADAAELEALGYADFQPSAQGDEPSLPLEPLPIPVVPAAG